MLRSWGRPLLFIPIAISFLLACMEVGAQSATPETSSPVTLPANTPVILQLKRSLYRKDAKPGHSVEFEVGYDVVLNGQVVIPSGTAVNGSVRQVEHGKGPREVLIDPGAVQAVSGEMVRLVWSSVSSNRESPVSEAVGMGSAAGPAFPVLVVASLFQKRVLLDADAWDGVWEVVRTADSVAFDPAKQKAGQEQFIANRKLVQAELCQLLASPDSINLDTQGRITSLARRSGLADSNKANVLHGAGDLDGAIDVFQQLVASRPDLPCMDKYPEISSEAFLTFAFSGTKEPDLRSFNAYSHVTLAGLYREKRDFARAISECRTAVQLEPEDENIRRTLISTVQDSGDLDAAIAESGEAIRLWPNNPDFHYLRGSALVQKKDADAAIVELQWVLKQARHDWPGANCQLGRAFEQKGDLEAAFRQYHIAYRAHLNDEQCRAAYKQLKRRLKK